MRRKHPLNAAWGKLLLADLEATAAGGGLMGDLCADAARRIRAQDARIVMLRKMLTRSRRAEMQAPAQ